jgi:23S rRNA (pseudouridine1915-N3)-methyltransferase
MRFTVVSVGKPRDAALAAAIRDYEERASRYWPLGHAEVREEPSRARTPDEVRTREGARLRAAIPKGSSVWLCDAAGKRHTSEEFAKWMQRAREHARDVAFIIGGAFGLDAELKAKSAGAISLSSLTFPHELARLVLAEQMYRAGTIIRGEPYHK